MAYCVFFTDLTCSFCTINTLWSDFNKLITNLDAFYMFEYKKTAFFQKKASDSSGIQPFFLMGFWTNFVLNTFF